MDLTLKNKSVDDKPRPITPAWELLPGKQPRLGTGSKAESRHALAEAFQSQARGCLLKSEGPEALLPALESVRHHHRFRSHGITAVCDDIARTNGKLATLTKRQREWSRWELSDID